MIQSGLGILGGSEKHMFLSKGIAWGLLRFQTIIRFALGANHWLGIGKLKWLFCDFHPLPCTHLPGVLGDTRGPHLKKTQN